MPNPFSYPEELQAEGVRLHRDEGLPLRQVGQRLGVSAESVRKWVRKAEAAEGADGRTDDDKAEIRRLQRELRRAQQERDILKKAVAFFARESEDR